MNGTKMQAEAAGTKNDEFRITNDQTRSAPRIERFAIRNLRFVILGSVGER